MAPHDMELPVSGQSTMTGVSVTTGCSPGRLERTSDNALFGNSLFPHDLDNFEEGEQKVLLRESLDVYVTILSDMLNQTQDMEITKSIMGVRAKMEDLRESYFHSREHALKRHLQNLWALKTDDVTTQRKAVRELLPVLQEVSRLGSRIHDSKQKQRRRRQTPKGRVPQP
ncbi:hypothetical protein SKAU_G00040690 [Synaphobranchus kaupii]|uniref:Uncharacterized protein n=1 Tax=Synaphobranchus kaupii TaxID=118154 RepID=A0A9Q1G143_SYNKA|nr:hypothetical protein SKAU_G00040690 [Synaphobranchus kaupii]